MPLMLLIGTVVIAISLSSCQQQPSSLPVQSTISPIGISYSERSDPNTPSADLYIEHSDGTKSLLRQNVNSDNDRNFLNSQVSKDCNKVVYTGYEDNNGDNIISFEDTAQIYIANLDGSDIYQIGSNSANNGLASWSPDSTQIAYMSDNGEGGEVWIANSDGTDAHQITTSANWAGHIHWSSNGEFIVFYSYDEDGSYLTVVNPDGSGYKRISENVGDRWGLFLNTDDRIIFWVDNLRYIVNADGSELSVFGDSNILIQDRERCSWPEKWAYAE